MLAGKFLAASAFTPFFVSKRMAEGERRHWLPSDDVFQMGQLLAMLLRGDAESLISVKDVGKLPCNDDLHAIVAKAICAGETGSRRLWRCFEHCKGTIIPSPSRLRALKGRRWPSPVYSRSGDLMPRSWSGRQEHPFPIK